MLKTPLFYRNRNIGAILFKQYGSLSLGRNFRTFSLGMLISVGVGLGGNFV
jgi:hypothetical protein